MAVAQQIEYGQLKQHHSGNAVQEDHRPPKLDLKIVAYEKCNEVSQYEDDRVRGQ